MCQSTTIHLLGFARPSTFNRSAPLQLQLHANGALMHANGHLHANGAQLQLHVHAHGAHLQLLPHYNYSCIYIPSTAASACKRGADACKWRTSTTATTFTLQLHQHYNHSFNCIDVIPSAAAATLQRRAQLQLPRQAAPNPLPAPPRRNKRQNLRICYGLRVVILGATP